MDDDSVNAKSSLEYDDSWENATSGGKISLLDDVVVDEWAFEERKLNQRKIALGELVSTAISGNDITSSCFYTIGLVMFISGRWAPISLLLVVLVLILYQSLYSEVGTVLPLNGGTYNILLNTTNKLMAAIAASLTILSYMATAVVSANNAMSYLNSLYDKVPVVWSTVLILAIFAIITWLGIGESSIIAMILFVLHIVTLILILAVGITTLIINRPGVLVSNWNLPYGPNENPGKAIFFGFCAGLLGVSGFESSSNYIEEQAPDVFPKTLRNMTILVSIFNPALAFIATALIPMSQILKNENELQLVLGKIALISCGKWFSTAVSIDAILVLSGAVLTTYVGVNGLVKRMALDRCLPQFLLRQNKFRKTNHWIILLFFLLTSSLVIIVWGDPITLSGVYTISFLSVLIMFGVGNLLLKYKRSKLPREHNAPVFVVIIAIGMALSALIGNILLNSVYLEYFSIYFSITLLIIMIMLTRTRILRWIYFSPLKKVCGKQLKQAMREINKQKMIFFTKNENICIMNKAILYVRENEMTDKLLIVHVYQSEELIPPRIKENIQILDEMYPKTTIDLALVKGVFTPALVEALSTILDVPKNFMYLTTPGERFPHRISEFGGVRLITH